MNEPIQGVIHGKTIELQVDPGLGQGQSVEVFLRPSSTNSTSGNGIRRTAGALADDTRWESIMEEIQQSRKSDRNSIEVID